MNAKLIFDNAGGLTLQLGKWAHWYQNMTQAANDFIEYRSNQSTSDWDGNESEALELEPTYDQIRNGGYRIYDPETIIELSENKFSTGDISWGNVVDFIKALRKLNQ